MLFYLVFLTDNTSGDIPWWPILLIIPIIIIIVILLFHKFLSKRGNYSFISGQSEIPLTTKTCP